MKVHTYVLSYVDLAVISFKLKSSISDNLLVWVYDYKKGKCFDEVYEKKNQQEKNSFNEPLWYCRHLASLNSTGQKKHKIFQTTTI